jgi:hypothetical protein
MRKVYPKFMVETVGEVPDFQTEEAGRDIQIGCPVREGAP